MQWADIAVASCIVGVMRRLGIRDAGLEILSSRRAVHSHRGILEHVSIGLNCSHPAYTDRVRLLFPSLARSHLHLQSLLSSPNITPPFQNHCVTHNMEAGLLSLAARRLAEMSETDAENKITRLQPDELASLVRYYNKKERERLAPQADVNEGMSATSNERARNRES